MKYEYRIQLTILVQSNPLSLLKTHYKSSGLEKNLIHYCLFSKKPLQHLMCFWVLTSNAAHDVKAAHVVPVYTVPTSVFFLLHVVDSVSRLMFQSRN